MVSVTARPRADRGVRQRKADWDWEGRGSNSRIFINFDTNIVSCLSNRYEIDRQSKQALLKLHVMYCERVVLEVIQG